MRCPNDPNKMCMSLFWTSTREPVSVKMADWRSKIQWILLDGSFLWLLLPLFSQRKHRVERTLHTFTQSKNQDLWHFSRLSMCRNVTKLWLKKEAKTGWKRTRNRQLMEVSKISHDIYDWLDKEDSGLIWTRTDDKRRQQRQHVDFSRWSTELEHWKPWPF